MATLVYKLTSI